MANRRFTLFEGVSTPLFYDDGRIAVDPNRNDLAPLRRALERGMAAPGLPEIPRTQHACAQMDYSGEPRCAACVAEGRYAL